MAEFFDESRWTKTVSEPDWYVTLYPELESLREDWDRQPKELANRMKREVRGFFKTAYETGRLALANEGRDMDAERSAIDTIVIHHTSSSPGYERTYMNATQLLNVYVLYFNNPDPEYAPMKGQPLWSGHVRGGQPVFYVYHWLMRMDGNFERLLEDHELGWHAGNWEVNCRSVGICLDNDYEGHDPDPEIIARLGGFIADHYPGIAPERIFGHGEVASKSTVCPGSGFEERWKQMLLSASRS